MNLKEYVEKLNKLLEDNPEAAEFMVVSSSADECNSFNVVHYDPSLGWYEDREWCTEKHENNAVCIN